MTKQRRYRGVDVKAEERRQMVLRARVVLCLQAGHYSDRAIMARVIKTREAMAERGLL